MPRYLAEIPKKKPKEFFSAHLSFSLFLVATETRASVAIENRRSNVRRGILNVLLFHTNACYRLSLFPFLSGYNWIVRFFRTIFFSSSSLRSFFWWTWVRSEQWKSSKILFNQSSFGFRQNRKKIKMHRMLVKMVVGMPEGRVTIFISLLAARSGRCGGARPKGDERVVYYRTMCSIWWRIDVGNYIYATASITLGKERRVLARARAWHTTATVCARGCRRNFDAPNFFHALKWLWSIFSFVVVFSSTPNQITRVERSRIIFVPKNT